MRAGYGALPPVVVTGPVGGAPETTVAPDDPLGL